MFAGFNNYYLPQYSADPNGNYERTADVDIVFGHAPPICMHLLLTCPTATTYP